MCKSVRAHTVVVASGDGVPQRVLCDHCNSQHNWRGGGAGTRLGGGGTSPAYAPYGDAPGGSEADAFPTVSERERSGPPMSVDGSSEDLEMMLRRVIREETGVTPVTPAKKWIGGEIAFRPGNPELQEKTIPIETFFSKIVALRNRMRTLEQQVNSSDLPAESKVKVQGYITACYGALTSFNILFADEADRFKGSGK